MMGSHNNNHRSAFTFQLGGIFLRSFSTGIFLCSFFVLVLFVLLFMENDLLPLLLFLLRRTFSLFIFRHLEYLQQFFVRSFISNREMEENQSYLKETIFGKVYAPLFPVHLYILIYYHTLATMRSAYTTFFLSLIL